MEINSKPEELDVLDRKIMQLEIEIEAIKREIEFTPNTSEKQNQARQNDQTKLKQSVQNEKVIMVK